MSPEKAIVISIRPEYALNILNGSKTLELRKKVPKDFVGWVYVYVTKGERLSVVHDDENGETYYYLDSNWGRSLNQDIPFRFWFDDYDDVSTKYRIDKSQIERVIEQACIGYDDFDKYVGDRENIYGWHIKKLEVFDKSMELSEFFNYKNYINSIGNVSLSAQKECGIKGNIDETKYSLECYRYTYNHMMKSTYGVTLKRPPQSWQYAYILGAKQ